MEVDFVQVDSEPVDFEAVDLVTLDFELGSALADYVDSENFLLAAHFD